MSDEADIHGSFPIVAVGGSAGGLAPTLDLLRELGTRPGLALVVIHHLDPTQDSGLKEILARATSLPVMIATEGTVVEPNHVYVVPPNADLLIEHGTLKLVPRVDGGGLHLPINRFFESLALERRGLAIGVVLSGSGTDGTDGVKLIKRHGGIVLAQDASAQFGSMPASIIATGCVDFILPPAALARELIRIGAHEPSTSSKNPGSEHQYAEVLEAMRQASGVDFAGYKQSTIRRRLERRLVLHGLNNLTGYLELLRREPAEAAALCEESLIHVTGFFREPETFEALSTLVLPKLCNGRTSEAPIRIWVPGCSTGEEVYSTAICVLEYLRANKLNLQVMLFGTDLSTSIVEKARAGKYPQRIENELSAERLQLFFTQEEGCYRIRRDVRDLCVFAKHDVGQDPPFSSMDLICCRNLLIYLGAELQDRVIALLHYALNEPGFLLLGNAETARAFPGFTAIDGRNKIYARSSAAPRLAFDFTVQRFLPEITPPAVSAMGIVAGPPAGRSLGPSDVYREADRLALAEFAPPGVVVTDDLAIVQFRGHTGGFLEHAPGAATLDLLRTVRQELRLPLRRTIDEARKTRSSAREAGIILFAEGKRRTLTLEVIPFAVHLARQRYFLVLFDDVTAREASREEAASAQSREDPAEAAGNSLRQELASTRQYLESVIEKLEATNEELKAANEEVVSSNEELRSTNEELQSAKEELQATNEELRVVNDEMRDRSVEATRLSDDLTNVLSSIELPILMVSRDLRLRKFTPAAATAFGLLPTDLGRLLEEIEPALKLAPALPLLAKQVLHDMPAQVSLIQDAAGRWRELSSHRYVALDGRIDGTVIAARDVEAEKKVRECQEQLQSMALDAALTEERERRRIAIELHDRMGQALALAEIKLTAVRGDLAAGPRAEIDAAVALLEQAITDTRVLIFELSPPLLYDLGLKEAICWLAEDVEKRHGIEVAVCDDATDKPLTDASKAILFRAVRELVMNVLKHSEVLAAKVTLQRTDDDIEVKVEDQGAGFDPKAPGAATSHVGFGLFSVGEQVARLGGAMKVDSKIGRGTRVSVRVPLNLPPAATTKAALAAAPSVPAAV